jgi:hypothetical protein
LAVAAASPGSPAGLCGAGQMRSRQVQIQMGR